MLYKVKMTPRQLATLHRWASLDGRDGREFATILIDVEEGGPTPALLVGQGDSRARIPHGGPPEDLDAPERDLIAESADTATLEEAIGQLCKAGYTKDDVLDAVQDSFSESA